MPDLVSVCSGFNMPRSKVAGVKRTGISKDKLGMATVGNQHMARRQRAISRAAGTHYQESNEGLSRKCLQSAIMMHLHER